MNNYNKLPYNLIHQFNKVCYKNYSEAVDFLKKKDLLPGETAYGYYFDKTIDYGINAIVAVGSIKLGCPNIIFDNIYNIESSFNDLSTYITVNNEKIQFVCNSIDTINNKLDSVLYEVNTSTSILIDNDSSLLIKKIDNLEKHVLDLSNNIEIIDNSIFIYKHELETLLNSSISDITQELETEFNNLLSTLITKVINSISDILSSMNIADNTLELKVATLSTLFDSYKTIVDNTIDTKLNQIDSSLYTYVNTQLLNERIYNENNIKTNLSTYKILINLDTEDNITNKLNAFNTSLMTNINEQLYNERIYNDNTINNALSIYNSSINIDINNKLDLLNSSIYKNINLQLYNERIYNSATFANKIDVPEKLSAGNGIIIKDGAICLNIDNTGLLIANDKKYLLIEI